MKLVEVGDNPRWKKEFLRLPVRLYRDEQNWIRPLDTDVENVFDPRKNQYFGHGECIRWLLLDERGQTIGRVAAFIDRNTAHTHEQPTGGLGFFECIDDQRAAFRLFDAGKTWLQSRGMEAMDGPINFGERDNWWGLLVEGFDYEPTYCMPYTKAYYIPFFEGYGFRDYFRQHTYGRPAKGLGVAESVHQRAQRVYQNPAYQFRHLDKQHLDQYAEDFRTIYNKAWVKHDGVKEMSEQQARAIIGKLKPIMDPEIIWFAYYDNQPVAFFIVLPEFNQIVKHLNGKLDLIGKLKFLWHKRRGTVKKVFGVAFGVVPEHQGKGVESAITLAYTTIGWKDTFPYEEFEMNWIGDFNPAMMRFVTQVGGKIKKTHVTYRLLFDPNQAFKRAREIGSRQLAIGSRQ
ncbi:MAG: hypothetical protein H7Z75_07755 [Ferruginibacter sp.]|nr:hypothetical protein [Cytophagales bacterium]